MALKLPIYNLFINKGSIEYDIENSSNNTLIIINKIENELVTSDFFGKILNSVNLILSQNCSILPIDIADKISISFLINSIKYDKVILIGIEPNNVGLSLLLNQFKIITIDSKKFIQLPSLNQISQNIDFKKKLWEVLKDLYK